MPTITQNDTPAGQSPVLALAHGSAPSIIDILPPAHIRDAAEAVRVWMEQNGYRGRWILGGICSRTHADDAKRVDWLDSFDSDAWWNDQNNPGSRGDLRKNIDAEMERQRVAREF